MPHIVVVDHEASIRELLRRKLSKDGFSVALAENAVAALALIRLDQPDAVVLDVELSPDDGVWCLQQIRLDPDMIGMSVVMISSHCVREIILRVEQYKVQGVVVKNAHLVAEVLDRLSRLKVHVRREHNRVAAEAACTPGAGALKYRRSFGVPASLESVAAPIVWKAGAAGGPPE